MTLITKLFGKGKQRKIERKEFWISFIKTAFYS
jgi:hypothetical protein